MNSATFFNLVIFTIGIGYVALNQSFSHSELMSPNPKISDIPLATTNILPTIKTEQNKLDRQECEVQKGKWITGPFGEGPFCNEFYADEGTLCTNGQSCLSGICLSDDGKIPGKCSKFKVVYGCNYFVKKERAQYICID